MSIHYEFEPLAAHHGNLSISSTKPVRLHKHLIEKNVSTFSDHHKWVGSKSVQIHSVCSAVARSNSNGTSVQIQSEFADVTGPRITEMKDCSRQPLYPNINMSELVYSSQC